MNAAKSLLVGLTLIASACGPARPPHTTVTPEPTAATTAPEPAPTPVHKPGPPLARRVDVVDTLHGVQVADPYRWLEDGDSEETKKFLADHDAFTRAHLDKLPGRDALTSRLTELSYIEWVGPPIRRGKRFFFERRHKDKEKRVWYWREGKEGTPKVLIDPNTLSEDGSIALKGLWPSYDGKQVAYTLSENNADESTLYVMEVASGKVSKTDVIAGAKYASASWDPKGTGFYYTRLPVDASIPVADRPGFAEIYFHKLGADPKTDKLIEGKTGDPTVFIGAYVSRDGNFLFFNKYYGWSKTDTYFRDLRKHDKWQPFAVGKDAKFYAYAWKEQIYVHTNMDAPRWRMFKVDPRKPALADWKEIVPEHQSAVLEDFNILGDHLVLTYLENASSRVKVVDLDGKHVRDIELPGIGSVLGPVGNPEDDTAYYGFSSYTTPSSVYETSVKKGGRKPYFELDVPVDPSPFTIEQVWYRSKDGTKVSMFVVHRKDMKKDGNNAVLLHGYGGFSINMTPYFDATWYPFLERGGVFAVPNLRGGAEYGEDWHRGGMLTKKQNVFDDFIGAAEFLIAQGYTKPERLAIRGGSNGGLLVGAAMTQRPDLFGAVVCSVPLLDMVRYHKFGSGKTWISEYGSADDADQFRALYGYSPYHRLQQGKSYPALLMLTADSDDRVDPLHARKFLAAARWANANDRLMLLRVETNAGHGGGDMVKKRVERDVDSYLFLFEQLKMGDAPAGS